MHRKSQTALYIIIAFPIVFAIPIILNLYFQPLLIQFSKLMYWFMIPTLLILVTPLGNYRIAGADNQTVRRPPFLWGMSVLMVVFFVFLLYLTESIMLLEQGRSLYAVNVRQGVYQTISAVWLHSIAFPWSVMAAAFAIFTVRSAKYSFHPYSSWISERILSPHFVRLTRKTIDSLIENATRIFVAFLLSLIIFDLLRAIGMKTFYLMPTILTLMGITFLPYSKVFNRVSALIERYQLPPILVFGLIIFASTILFLLVNGLVYFGSPYLDLMTQSMLRFEMPPIINQFWVPTWTLWYWSWWLIILPLVVSLIARISIGYSLRAVVILLLILPTILTLIYHIHPLGFQNLLRKLTTVILYGRVVFMLQLLALVFFLALFVSRSGHYILRLGYHPLEKPMKMRLFLPKGLWYMTAALISALTLRGLYGVVMLQLFIAPYFLIVLLIGAVYRLPKASEHRETMPRQQASRGQ